MVVGQWALILPNWTAKMQATPSCGTILVEPEVAMRISIRLLPVYNGGYVRQNGDHVLTPAALSTLRLSAHANIVLRGRYLAKNRCGNDHRNAGATILARRDRHRTS